MFTEIITIIIINIFFYARTIKYGCVSDDLAVVKRAEKYPKANLLTKILLEWRNRAFFSLKRSHAISMVIHTLNCILILYAFKGQVGFLTACLFAVNPANEQGSIWMSGRNYARTTTIVLIIWIFKPLFLLLYPISFMESFAGLPLVIIMLTTEYWWQAALLPILGLIFYPFTKQLINRMKGKAKTATPLMKSWHPRKIVLHFKTIWYYLIPLGLFPTRLAMYPNYMYTWGVSVKDNKYWLSFNKHFWWGLLTSIILWTLIIINWGNGIGFGLFWWYCFITLWCHYPITMHQAVGTRYGYLANVGLMYALATFILEVDKWF